MASLNPHPQFALSGELDLRAWRGVVGWSRGSDDITIPSDADVIDDLVRGANGYGSQAGRDASADLQAAFTASGAAGTITQGIDADDKVYVETSATNIFIDAGAANALLGFSTAGHAYPGVGPPYRITAPDNFSRGTLSLGNANVITFEAFGTGTPFVFPSVAQMVQSVPTLIRTSAMGDADDGVADSLETLDNDAHDPTDRRIRHGITDAGHYYIARRTTATTALTWESTTLRDRLGFTGSEAEVTTGTLAVLTAANPLPGFLTPGRTYDRVTPRIVEVSSQVELTSGSMGFNHVAAWDDVDVQFVVDGPADARPSGQRDHSRHWLRCIRDYWPKGSRIRFFQHWGDPRRALQAHQVTASQAAYSTLYNSELDGYRGALRCRRRPDDADPALAWAQALRRRLQVSMALRVQADG